MYVVLNFGLGLSEVFLSECVNCLYPLVKDQANSSFLNSEMESRSSLSKVGKVFDFTQALWSTNIDLEFWAWKEARFLPKCQLRNVSSSVYFKYLHVGFPQPGFRTIVQKGSEPE